MVRFQDDVDGCGCLRCQNVDHAVVQRSLSGALVWSSQLPLLRPSILLVFLAVGAGQLVALLVSAPFALVTVLFGVLGAFVARGYIGVVGRQRLGHEEPAPARALAVVFRRLPAFLGAVLALVALLVALVVVIAVVVTPAVHRALEPAGIAPFTVDVLVVLFTAAMFFYVFVKAWFVPEACFVGGYGPLAAMGVSWRITGLHRRKAFLLVLGFAALLGLGIVLDTHLASGQGSPIALTVQVGETTVVLRSFGLSLAGGVRFTFDMIVTALYSGVFVHQYVSGIVTE